MDQTKQEGMSSEQQAPEKSALEQQAAAGAIVHEGKVLSTTFEIAEAAKRCDSTQKAAALMDAVKRASGAPDLVLGIVANLCKAHPCAQYFRASGGPEAGAFRDAGHNPS